MRGVIEKIWENDGRGAATGKKVYDIVVGGVRYGAGYYRPNASEGDTVEFDTETKGKYINARNIKKASGNGHVQSPAETAVFGPGPVPAGKTRDENIRLLNAGNIASQLLSALVPLLPPESTVPGNLLDRWKELVDGILERYDG